MLTLFCIPRGKGGAYDTIQTNALASWGQFDPPPAVVLMGRPDETAGWAEDGRAELSLRCVDGIPLISDAFSQAKAYGEPDWIKMFVNADILLVTDLNPVLVRVAAEFETFLAVGQRHDTDLDAPVDFADPDWRAVLKAYTHQYAQMRGPDAIDYFIWRGDLWDNMPDFAVGRMAWDNWLIGWAITNGVPVVDVTNHVLALHPRHPRSNYTLDQVMRNRQMSHLDQFKGNLTIRHAPYRLVNGTIKRVRVI